MLRSVEQTRAVDAILPSIFCFTEEEKVNLKVKYKEHIRATDEQYDAIADVQRMLQPHPKSGKGSSFYFLFKLIASGCETFDDYSRTQSYLGSQMSLYGYRRKLKARQLRNILPTLIRMGLIKTIRLTDSRGRDAHNRYILTDFGRIVYYKIVKKNQGDVIVLPPSTSVDVFLINKLRASNKNYPTFKDLLESTTHNNLSRAKARPYAPQRAVKAIDEARVNKITEHINQNMVKKCTKEQDVATPMPDALKELREKLRSEGKMLRTYN